MRQRQRERQRNRFRPSSIEGLEERVVLSQGITPPTLATLVLGRSQPTALDFQSVQNALNQSFGEFQNEFLSAEVVFLTAAKNATPAAVTKALSTLHQTTDQLVSQLLASVQTSVSPLPGTLTGLMPAIMAQVNGSFSGSMLKELNSIPATTGPNGGPDVLYSQVAAAAINATQLAANDMLTAYWAGYLGAYTSHGTAPGFDYAAVQAQINQALTALQTNYKVAEANFLSSGGSSMKPSPIAFALLQVNTTAQINLTLANLGSELTGVPGFLPLLSVQVNGPFTGSLRIGLGRIPIASAPGGTVGNLFSLVSTDLFNSTQLAANNLLSVYNAGRIGGLASAGFSVTPFVASPPALTIAQLVQLDQAGTGVQQAYAQFQLAYENAITNTLYANVTPGGSGPVDLTANQAAFNAQVAAALGAMNGSLATNLGLYSSAANNLLPSIGQALTGTGAVSLQSRLAALAIPTDLFGDTTVQFLNRANSLLVASYVDTITRFNGAALNPRFNFAGFTGSASFLNGPFGIQLLPKTFDPAPLGGLFVADSTGVRV